MKRTFIFLGSLLLSLALQAADSNATAKKSGTHKVKVAPFKIELSLKGIFTPTETAPIKVKPEVCSDLTLARDAATHGSSVKENDLLILLKKEKLTSKFGGYGVSIGIEKDSLIADNAFSFKSLTSDVFQNDAIGCSTRNQSELKESIQYLQSILDDLI